MNYPREPWGQGRLSKILMWLSMGVVLLWLGRALSGGFLGRGFLKGFQSRSLSAGTLFILALSLALGGLLLWKGLTVFFWRKYFPTQNPPPPPKPEKDDETGEGR